MATVGIKGLKTITKQGIYRFREPKAVQGSAFGSDVLGLK